MIWNKDARYRLGGFWKCRIRKNDWARNQYATNPEVRLDRQLRNISRIRVVN